MIVQTDLPYRPDRRGRGGLCAYEVSSNLGPIGKPGGLMGVDANREACCRPQNLESRGLGGLLLVAGREDAERVIHAGGAGPFDDRVEVTGEHLVGEMAVRVDHARYRTREPSGGGASNPTTTGAPPSGLAASTMPLDSMPMSLAGFRLATTTRVRPTSDSGA